MGSTSTTGWTTILLTILISWQAQGEQLILQIFLTFGPFQVHQLQNNSRDINLHGGIEKVVIIFPNINIPCQTHVVHRWSWNMSYGTHGTLTPIVQNQRWTTRCQIEKWKLQVDNNVSIPETWADFSHRNIQASQAARSESICWSYRSREYYMPNPNPKSQAARSESILIICRPRKNYIQNFFPDNHHNQDNVNQEFMRCKILC